MSNCHGKYVAALVGLVVIRNFFQFLFRTLYNATVSSSIIHQQCLQVRANGFSACLQQHITEQQWFSGYNLEAKMSNDPPQFDTGDLQTKDHCIDSQLLNEASAAVSTGSVQALNKQQLATTIAVTIFVLAICAMVKGSLPALVAFGLGVAMMTATMLAHVYSMQAIFLISVNAEMTETIKISTTN